VPRYRLVDAARGCQRQGWAWATHPARVDKCMQSHQLCRRRLAGCCDSCRRLVRLTQNVTRRLPPPRRVRQLGHCIVAGVKATMSVLVQARMSSTGASRQGVQDVSAQSYATAAYANDTCNHRQCIGQHHGRERLTGLRLTCGRRFGADVDARRLAGQVIDVHVTISGTCRVHKGATNSATRTNWSVCRHEPSPAGTPHSTKQRHLMHARNQDSRSYVVTQPPAPGCPPVRLLSACCLLPVAKNLPSGEKEMFDGCIGSIGCDWSSANSRFGENESRIRMPRSPVAIAMYLSSGAKSMPVHEIVEGKGGGGGGSGVPSGAVRGCGGGGRQVCCSSGVVVSKKRPKARQSYSAMAAGAQQV
jgi:hypothetical protein